MAITSVVLGAVTPGGGWDAGKGDCAKDAAGSRDTRRGSSSFMVYLE
jgi:hypothetical protein